jgi:hypothetical protein
MEKYKKLGSKIYLSLCMTLGGDPQQRGKDESRAQNRKKPELNKAEKRRQKEQAGTIISKI